MDNMSNDKPVRVAVRAVLCLLAVAPLLVMFGDGRIVAQSGTPVGIDPLEILSLQVKPNVIVFLDSSGTFSESPEGGHQLANGAGDWVGSKEYEMKQVFRNLVAANESKANFLFGQFTQANSTLTNTGAGADRFFYTTTNLPTSTPPTDSDGFPSMATTELSLTKTDATDTGNRGMRTWQDIRTGWNILTYQETAGTTVTCTVTIPAQFYGTGASLATAIAAAMNGCTGRATPNIYYATFSGANGNFTIGKCTAANTPVAGCVAGGAHNFKLRWSVTPNNIGRSLGSTADTTSGAGPFTTGTGYSLLHRSTGDDFTDNNVKINGVPTTRITYYLRAGRFFNGETYDVLSNGTLCGQRGAAAPTNPPSVSLQQVASCGGATVGGPVKFRWAGGTYGGNTNDCGGYQVNSGLVRCDVAAGTQVGAVTPMIDLQMPLSTDGLTPKAPYAEAQDGTWAMTVAPPQGGMAANGSTPLAAAMAQIQTLFVNLWNNGQAVGPLAPNGPVLPPLKNHTNPKERTIVLFVTDASGNDSTCGHGTENDMILETAYRAQTLYQPIVGGAAAVNADGSLSSAADPASSVTTYVIGLGQATTLLNYIAWGGSGMRINPGTTSAGFTAWGSVPTTAQRAACTACHDAFIVPDADTLSVVLQQILEAGATSGQFTAQQSVVAPVYEDVAEVTGTFGGELFHPGNPDTRYFAVLPTLFRSSFSLPGFRGSLSAVTNEVDSGGNHVPFSRWDAGQVLLNTVRYGAGGTSGASTGMSSCGDDVAGSGNCVFVHLASKIQRHIYTSAASGTPRNGVFPVTIANYFDTTWIRADGNRLALWPPASTVAPNPGISPSDYAATGTAALDAALGLSSMTFAQLQSAFGACLGPSAPAACTSGTPSVQLAMTLKEARHIVLAYLAGAETVPDPSNSGKPLRVTSAQSTTYAGQLVFRARAWPLAEGTLGAPAVAAPPVETSPTATGFDVEYQLFRDGPRNTTGGATTDTTEATIDVGYGLRNPDRDSTFSGQAVPRSADTRTNIKPVMTVVYMPANDMLHAFRAGPSAANATRPTLSPAANNCTATTTKDCGGEELWGFVPYDQLGKLQLFLAPQSHTQANYVVAAGIRFTDVFVPNAGTTGNYNAATTTKTVGSITTPAIQGVWRKLMIFGRGIAGSYMTALDITAPGPYTRTVKDTTHPIVGPIVLWSRGNPDTQDGSPTSTNYNNTPADFTSYQKMGQTWSMPAVVLVDRMKTTRKPCNSGDTNGVCTDQTSGGVNMVAIMGSGYGATGANPRQGTTLFTLDTLTGDIIQAADVGVRTSPPTYDNAIVASPSAYVPNFFVPTSVGHPMNDKATRVYVGDLHGRVWKFRTANLSAPILFADIGGNQPIATAISLLRLPFGTGSPHLYGETGNDSRADASTTTFKLFAFDDNQTDTDTTGPSPSIGPSTITACMTAPQGTTTGACLFARNFEPFFRGTVQPATVYALDPTSGTEVGRVFFAGTRLIAPPPAQFSTPVGSTGGPCRSRFDSIVYALRAEAGTAAYDLNSGTGQDEFVILNNSRIVGLTTPSAQTSTGSQLQVDEGMGTGAVSGGVGVMGGTGTRNEPPPSSGALQSITGNVSFSSTGGGIFINSRVCEQ